MIISRVYYTVFSKYILWYSHFDYLHVVCGDDWRLLKITGDYWRLLEMTEDAGCENGGKVWYKG